MRTDHSPTAPGTGPRRFLIAAAVAEHAHGPQWDRPGLVAARAAMVELFTGTFGYALVPTPGVNPTAAQLLSELDAFCNSPDRRPDDIVAIYFTGHGERLPHIEDHVLLTTDTHPDRVRLATTTAQLARTVLYQTPVRRVLLMLDTCYSGKGGADFTAAALDDYTHHWDETPGNGIVVISSAQPHQTADAGQFPRLFTEAVQSLSIAGHGPEAITIPALVTKMNARAADTPWQVVGSNEVRLIGDAPPFLPNPRHDRQLYEVDLALQEAAEWEVHEQRRDVELRDRLLVRAMGSADGKSWWFTGRHTALTDVTTWLHHPDRTRPLLAVTADPGSGKTAVLGVIAALTHPDYHRTVPIETLGLPANSVPTVGVVDVVIYAQNLTLDQVRDGIAAAARLTVGTVGELLNGLTGRDKVFTVLIDGLDEAADPDQLTRKLLRPLVDHADGRIRLLIGTRPYLLPILATAREHEIDLDAPRYADLSALTTYTVRGLLDAAPESAYLRQDPPVLRAIADAVAEQATPSFLVARIVAATLAADPTVPDPRDPAWRDSLPSLPGEAMRRDLDSRLRGEARKARDLLRPLAFAQGQGLPWEDLWARLASALSGVDYTDHDLMWLRRAAGSYVVEAVENGRSAYRLYHQALAEHLTEHTDSRAAHEVFVTTLTSHVAPDTWGRRDWGRAHPYIRLHLATHAAHAGVVDDLVTDMDYLVHAEAASLLDALHTVTTDTALLNRAIYRCSADLHRYLLPARRRRLLAIDAARFGAPAQQSDLDRGQNWRTAWATGGQTDHALRTTLIGGTVTVYTVACTSIEDRPVAVTGCFDHTVRVWDLSTGTELSTLTGHTDSVFAVACTSIEDRPVAVTGSVDHTVRVWDLSTGTELATLTGHTGTVNTVACTSINGRPVAVTGSVDHTVRVWDLIGKASPVPLVIGTRDVLSVACTSVNGRPVAVTGSYDATVRVWDLSTGTELSTLTGHTGSVFAVACTSIEDRPVAVTGSFDHTVRVWDLSTGTELATLTGHTDMVYTVACTSIGGRPVAVTGSVDHTARVWDLTPGTSHAKLIGHTNTVFAVACTSIDGRPIAVSGSADRTVRVWDLSTGTELATLTGHTNPVYMVACTSINGRPVAVISTEDDMVQVWNLVTRNQPGIYRADGYVSSVACVDLDRRRVVILGDVETGMRIWELPSSVHGAKTSVGRWLRRRRPRALDLTDRHPELKGMVAAARLENLPVAICTNRDRSVRVWDLTSMTEVAVFDCPSRPRAVACSGSSVIIGFGNDLAVLTRSTSGTSEPFATSRGHQHTSQ